MPTADEIRDGQRAAWAGLAPSWARWEAVIMAQLAPVTAAMIEVLRPADGGRHLDVASGTGEPGLTIARSMSAGRVVLTDLAPEMLAIAAQRAAAGRVGCVETVVCSADDLPFDDASFDTASVRFGHMFFPDPAAATAELARVLAPGGRVCTSVWAGIEANPWTGLALAAIATEFPLPAPRATAPGMFRLAEPGAAGALLTAAGLREVTEWDVPVELVTGSAEEYWAMLSEHASLPAAALARATPAARERIGDRALLTARAFERDGRIRMPGLARCAAGTRGPAPEQWD